MNSSSLRYLIGEGGGNLRANRQMSIASIGVLMACMLLIGAAILLSLNVNALMRDVERQNEVVAFVALDATEEEIRLVEQEINRIANVSDPVEYVSKEDALLEQMGELGEAASILEGLAEDNPLPASFRIKVIDLDLLGETKAQLEAIENVYQVSAATDVVSIILDVSRGINLGGFVIVVILASVSVLIVSNTIKVTIFNRRKEISIMKYVGATDAFIRLPFLVEGMLIGLISALLAFGLLWVAYEYVLRWMGQATSVLMQSVYQSMIPFAQIASLMMLGFVGAGVLFGLLGSLFFVGRYLKV